VAVTIAYASSFGGAFVFDDYPHIVDAPHLVTFSPWLEITRTSRPLVGVTLVVNYALGRLDVFGYHLLNLIVHLLATLALWDLVRRTLRTESVPEPWRSRARPLAFSVALLWGVHPLTTEAVTYIIQRAESLAALATLGVLLGVSRAQESTRPWRWLGPALTAALCGALSKPVFAIAPILVLLYDVCFMSGSLRAALSRRGLFYVALALVASLAPMTLRLAPWEWQGTAGPGTTGVTALGYALTEPGVIAHYLRLAFWPRPLCLDYGWPIATQASVIVPPALLIAALLGVVVFAWGRRPAAGFAGAWFFIMLAPTSSVIPVADLAFEHRMYLPLAAVITVAVLGVDATLGVVARRARWTDRGRSAVAVTLLAALAVTLGGFTALRNLDYRSRLTIWSQTLTVVPRNARAHFSYGIALRDAGALGEAEHEFRIALSLRPDDADTHVNLGQVREARGDSLEALREYRTAVALDSLDALARYDLGALLFERCELEEAVPHLRAAARLSPKRAPVQNTLGAALFRAGRREEAVAHFQEALRIDPDAPEARCNLGFALAAGGRPDDARREFEAVLARHPEYRRAQQGLELLGSR
jgi:Flp pilus assembly protein TadD